MTNIKNNYANPKAIKNANDTWNRFVFVAKICTIVICTSLLIMGLTLV